jgi:uncharacterized membrane protein YhaH (DUF805 family)
MKVGLFPRAALYILQVRLAQLTLLALRFADKERSAAHILGFIELVVGQNLSPSGRSTEFLIVARAMRHDLRGNI